MESASPWKLSDVQERLQGIVEEALIGGVYDLIDNPNIPMSEPDMDEADFQWHDGAHYEIAVRVELVELEK